MQLCGCVYICANVKCDAYWCARIANCYTFDVSDSVRNILRTPTVSESDANKIRPYFVNHSSHIKDTNGLEVVLHTFFSVLHYVFNIFVYSFRIWVTVCTFSLFAIMHFFKQYFLKNPICVQLIGFRHFSRLYSLKCIVKSIHYLLILSSCLYKSIDSNSVLWKSFTISRTRYCSSFQQLDQ